MRSPLEAFRARLPPPRRDTHHPHAWVVHSLDTLRAPLNVEEALEERPNCTRHWIQGSIESAAEAVALFDMGCRPIDLHDTECD